MVNIILYVFSLQTPPAAASVTHRKRVHCFTRRRSSFVVYVIPILYYVVQRTLLLSTASDDYTTDHSRHVYLRIIVRMLNYNNNRDVYVRIILEIPTRGKKLDFRLSELTRYIYGCDQKVCVWGKT